MREDANILTARYEDLRRHVLDRSRNPSGAPGWAVFVRHGMRAWMDIDAFRTPAVEGRASAKPELTKPLSSSVQAQLTMVLAGMVFNNEPKEML